MSVVSRLSQTPAPASPLNPAAPPHTTASLPPHTAAATPTVAQLGAAALTQECNPGLSASTAANNAAVKPGWTAGGGAQKSSTGKAAAHYSGTSEKIRHANTGTGATETGATEMIINQAIPTDKTTDVNACGKTDAAKMTITEETDASKKGNAKTAAKYKDAGKKTGVTNANMVKKTDATEDDVRTITGMVSAGETTATSDHTTDMAGATTSSTTETTANTGTGLGTGTTNTANIQSSQMRHSDSAKAHPGMKTSDGETRPGRKAGADGSTAVNAHGSKTVARTGSGITARWLEQMKGATATAEEANIATSNLALSADSKMNVGNGSLPQTGSRHAGKGTLSQIGDPHDVHGAFFKTGNLQGGGGSLSQADKGHSAHRSHSKTGRLSQGHGSSDVGSKTNADIGPSSEVMPTVGSGSLPTAGRPSSQKNLGSEAGKAKSGKTFPIAGGNPNPGDVSVNTAHRLLNGNSSSSQAGRQYAGDGYIPQTGFNDFSEAGRAYSDDGFSPTPGSGYAGVGAFLAGGRLGAGMGGPSSGAGKLLADSTLFSETGGTIISPTAATHVVIDMKAGTVSLVSRPAEPELGGKADLTHSFPISLSAASSVPALQHTSLIFSKAAMLAARSLEKRLQRITEGAQRLCPPVLVNTSTQTHSPALAAVKERRKVRRRKTGTDSHIKDRNQHSAARDATPDASTLKLIPRAPGLINLSADPGELYGPDQYPQAHSKAKKKRQVLKYKEEQAEDMALTVDLVLNSALREIRQRRDFLRRINANLSCNPLNTSGYWEVDSSASGQTSTEDVPDTTTDTSGQDPSSPILGQIRRIKGKSNCFCVIC